MSTIKLSIKERRQDRNFFKYTPLFTVFSMRDRQWSAQQLSCGWLQWWWRYGMGCGVVLLWHGWAAAVLAVAWLVGIGVTGMLAWAPAWAAVAAGTVVHLDPNRNDPLNVFFIFAGGLLKKGVWH
jgi:hypothetical protein